MHPLDDFLLHTGLGEDTLQHYGVLGMRWGVRRAAARASSTRKLDANKARRELTRKANVDFYKNTKAGMKPRDAKMKAVQEFRKGHRELSATMKDRRKSDIAQFKNAKNELVAKQKAARAAKVQKVLTKVGGLKPVSAIAKGGVGVKNGLAKSGSSIKKGIAKVATEQNAKSVGRVAKEVIRGREVGDAIRREQIRRKTSRIINEIEKATREPRPRKKR